MPMKHKLRQLTLDQLRSFLLVAELRSFTRAADEQQRTQTALSRQISTLEDVFGERLLVRSRGHVSGLTDAGQRLLRHARQILATVDEAWESLQKPTIQGRIRVGVMDDVNVSWLNELLSQFKSVYPGCQVQAVSDFSVRLAQRLEAGELDLALLKHLRGTPRPPGARLLWQEPLRWARGAGFHWDESVPLPLVLFHEGCAYRQRLLQRLHKQGIVVQVVYDGQSYANVGAAAFAGLGLTALPQSQVEAAGLLACARLGQTLLPDLGSVEIVARHRPSSADEALRQFLALLIRHARQGMFHHWASRT